MPTKPAVMECKNCNNIFKGKYCNNCGQPADTHRLDFHFLWHDIQHGLFHFDAGLLYSGKQLFLRPGHTIREFIAGKRVKHFKPISMVIILAVTYGLLYHNFDIDNTKPFINAQNQSVNYAFYNEWIAMHFSWITLASIPFYTLGTFICFRKQGYNFIEYFILNTFKASQRLIVHLATFPLLVIYSGTIHIKTLLAVFYVIDLLLGFLTNVQFFNQLPKGKTILLSIGSHLIFLCGIFVVLIAGMLLLGY